MRRPRHRTLQLAALLALGLAATSAGTQAHGLQPYQMVRSLQLVQDRIADGDHAALPMQKKLLELIDQRFRTAGNAEFEDHRNVDALMIYAMSGGNPSTIADTLARLDIDEARQQAGAGVLGYLLGDMAQAQAAMGSIDPAGYPTELAAFLSLVKGSVLGLEDAAAGIALLDHARLESPGTLVEEAALRRTIALAVSVQDSGKFMSTAEQYARRYLRSPYASQFAESLVSGIIALRQHKLDLRAVEQTIAWMSAEQAKTIYLRLARRAAIDGDAVLLEFASRHASELPDAVSDASDPRSQLYSSISSVTSETVEKVLSQLQDLDTSKLSTKDRALLDAAKTIASEVVAPVSARPGVTFQPQPIASVLTRDEPMETDALVTAARSKLDAIDKLLEETGP